MQYPKVVVGKNRAKVAIVSTCALYTGRKGLSHFATHRSAYAYIAQTAVPGPRDGTGTTPRQIYVAVYSAGLGSSVRSVMRTSSSVEPTRITSPSFRRSGVCGATSMLERKTGTKTCIQVVVSIKNVEAIWLWPVQYVTCSAGFRSWSPRRSGTPGRSSFRSTRARTDAACTPLGYALQGCRSLSSYGSVCGGDLLIFVQADTLLLELLARGSTHLEHLLAPLQYTDMVTTKSEHVTFVSHERLDSTNLGRLESELLPHVWAGQAF